MTTHEDGLREALTVAQVDRKDAANYLRSIRFITGCEMDTILRGKWDRREEVQWFARHRIAALSASPKPAESEVERVARALAGSGADEMVQAGNPIGEPCDYPKWMLFQPDARRVLAALAKQKEASSDLGGEPVFRRAVEAVIEATREYLPPDGITAQALINRVLEATDNPTIFAALHRPAHSSDLAEALEVMREIRAKASGREPLPLPSGTKESHRNVALENLAILGGIERLSAAFAEKHRGGGK